MSGTPEITGRHVRFQFNKQNTRDCREPCTACTRRPFFEPPGSKTFHRLDYRTPRGAPANCQSNVITEMRLACVCTLKCGTFYPRNESKDAYLRSLDPDRGSLSRPGCASRSRKYRDARCQIIYYNIIVGRFYNR